MKTVITVIAFSLAVYIVCTLLVGCRESRELRKDDKAFARVLTRSELLKRMDAELDARFPCTNTVIKTEYKEGKIVEVPVLVFDSIRVKKYLDSVRAATPQTSDSIAFLECTRLITESYNTAYKQAVWECNQKKPQIRVDTFYTTQIDGKRISQLEAERDVLTGKYLQSEKQAEIAFRKAQNQFWWIVALLVALGLSLFGNVRGFLRKNPSTSLSGLLSFFQKK